MQETSSSGRGSSLSSGLEQTCFRDGDNGKVYKENYGAQLVDRNSSSGLP